MEFLRTIAEQLNPSERRHGRWHLPRFARSRPSRARCFLALHRAVAIQEISPPRMNTYMIMALCAAKMIPRGSFRSAPTPGIVGLPRLSFGHIYHVKLLWRINHTPRILANSSDKLGISTDTFALFTFYRVTDIIRTATYRSEQVIAFRRILPCFDEHPSVLSLSNARENYSLLFRLFKNIDIIRLFLNVKSYPSSL